MGSLLQLVCFIWLTAANQTAHAITIPFFGSFGSRQPAPSSSSGSGTQYLQESREPRIINADHGGPAASSSSGSSMAGGNIGVSPWISGTRDQFMRDQLVILHPDSPINREAWKSSGYLSPDFEHRPKVMNHGSLPLSPPPITTMQPQRTQQQRARKLHRKPKQHTPQQQNAPNGVNEEPMTGGGGAAPSPTAIPNNALPPPPSFNLLPFSGGLYEIPSSVMFRDINAPAGETDDATIISSEPYPIIFSPFPLISPNLVPVSPRANNQAMPPDGVIQLLKSPEQEISPLTRPQVKLPFPLSRDCSSSSGSGSNKPLQFVVLPIVEPVAPLKPIIPKPPFLSSQSQYGHFPYIPPFNLFKKPLSQLDSSNGGGSGGSGQFVPILNRPAPPLPFVFVQSLPLELIGHNVEMDVLQQPSPTTNTETKVKEPFTPPPPSSPIPVASENVASASRPLPLIVIEKVKTPGQQPSASVGSAAAVVEISKQSIQKNANSGSSPLSTISVVRPITPPGSSATQEEIQKAIEKLVPVAAAVLQEQEKEPGRERDVINIAPEDEVGPREQNPPPPTNITPSVVEPNNSIAESEKSVMPLRSPLRPESTPEADYAQNPNSHKKPDLSSSEEIGISTGMLRDIEVMEA